MIFTSDGSTKSKRIGRQILRLSATSIKVFGLPASLKGYRIKSNGKDVMIDLGYLKKIVEGFLKSKGMADIHSETVVLGNYVFDVDALDNRLGISFLKAGGAFRHHIIYLQDDDYQLPRSTFIRHC